MPGAFTVGFSTGFGDGTRFGGTVSVIDDLVAVETALRQQADAIAKTIADLQAADDALDAASDVIEAD